MSTVETYPVKINGRETRVTIPDSDPTDEQILFDAMKDNFSPQAVAAIVAHLQPAATTNPNVDCQLRWFVDRLTDLVGGPEQLDSLCDELGL